MNNKWKRKLGIYLSLGIFLSGCNVAESPNNLIKAPQLEDGQKWKLYETLKQLVPPGMEYVTPKGAVVKQSIFMDDVDNDGKLEAFVVYKQPKENGNLHLLVLKENKESWLQVALLETEYQILDYFNMHNLDNEGGMEIVIGLGTSDFEPERQLFIYQYGQDGLGLRVNRAYHLLDFADYDEDQKTDVLLVEGKRRESFTAGLFHYKEGKLVRQSSVDLDAYAFHEHMTSGTLRDGQKALFIDSKIGVHAMITEIVAYDQGNLVSVDMNQDIKEYLLYSQDINKDGITEVGGMYVPKGWEDAPFEDIPFIEFYSSHSISGKAEKVTERYTDREHGFYIEIPVEWQCKVTPKKVKNGIQLLSIPGEVPIFEIRWTNKDSSEVAKYVLKKSQDTIFYSNRDEYQTFPFKQFHLLEDDF
ncbi:VCBS repeat-containing protein [Fredinandcohnia quinoae]|uniref:VCBS repeat-containing protein n=1 Tax=Fredinandcohnia quinoae TaxID=2918902 RepID=A0AAW5E3G2_9BACI|nr:VCBS repeat-containing protein [Fredinandcohnia sp. SECRCQ15]MCH1627467.1 VCBS repeat-containing protein [Fredinandcohnia sp. SECRCQ15]